VGSKFTLHSAIDDGAGGQGDHGRRPSFFIRLAQLRRATEPRGIKQWSAVALLFCVLLTACADSSEATRRKAEKGDAAAQRKLGWMYAQGERVPKDSVEAVKWYRKAAEQGHAVAQSNLGFMYANGDGVLKDETEAVKWYRKAAERGVALAQSQLGWMYENGSGVPKDPVEAVKWCRKAAEQGYAAAQHNLGVMYYNGTGVIKNPAQAHAWWSIAGSRGFKEAKKNLVSLEKEMTAEQKAEAMKLERDLFAKLRKK